MLRPNMRRDAYAAPPAAERRDALPCDRFEAKGEVVRLDLDKSPPECTVLDWIRHIQSTDLLLRGCHD